MSQQLNPTEIKEVWQTACAQFELELSRGVYNAWILPNPLTSVETEGETAIATFTSPTAFHSTNLKRGFGAHLQKVLGAILNMPVTIAYEVGTLNNPPTGQGKSFTSQVHSQTPPPSSLNGFHQTTPSTPTSSPSPRVEDLFSQATLQASGENQAQVRAKNIGLRTDYVFETFAVSGSNEMAHAAATAVSKSPGSAYNPLFLYGGVGVGKTHLMHAIGHNILLSNPSAKIIYCTGEEFTNQIVGAIRNKSAIDFKERFRTIDVLLIDDIQFIAGKNTVQEEFFHTFNALTKRMSQIVLTSDRPPHEIALLESRLRSRFEAGLMIDIQQPSFELRTAILLIKAKALHIPLTIEMAKTIAARVDSARKMEGILNSIRSSMQLRGKDLDDELVERALLSETDAQRPNLNAKIQDVVKTVANHYRLKQSELKGQSRKKDTAHARHIAMYLCKEDLKEPYAEIGRWFSDRDHTTVMHAVNKISEMLQSEDSTYEEVSALRMSLAGLRR
jgi:chromosomal replication initiator protein